MPHRFSLLTLAVLVIAIFFVNLLLLAPNMLAHAADKPGQAADQKPPYTVVNGKVDLATFNGYRRYGESCLRCHGPDGAGSSYAPDLTESLKHMTPDQFNEVVVNGRKNVSTSSNNVMPAFGMTEDVVNYLPDIYGYLKARADGALGRGRPKRIDGDD
ncbi:MAG: cytochrome c protein [Rhodospirillales bacterium]|nr:cytochrome c protein [Rhodospirillales bacterium]